MVHVHIEPNHPFQQLSSIRQHTSAYVSMRQHTSAYGSIRQHTSAYVSIRQRDGVSQHTSTLSQHTLQLKAAYTSSLRPHTLVAEGLTCSPMSG
jgi:hypothetical protein